MSEAAPPGEVCFRIIKTESQDEGVCLITLNKECIGIEPRWQRERKWAVR